MFFILFQYSTNNTFVNILFMNIVLIVFTFFLFIEIIIYDDDKQ